VVFAMSAAHARGEGEQCAEECGEECDWGGARLREAFARAGSPAGSPEQTWGQWGAAIAIMGVCVAASGESARAGDAAEAAAEEEAAEEEEDNSVEGQFESQKWGDGEWWNERPCTQKDGDGDVWTAEDEYFHPTKGGLGPWWVEGSQEFSPAAAGLVPADSPQSDTEVAAWWGRDSAVGQGRGEEGRGEEGRGEEGRGEERAAAADVPAGTGQAPNADPPPPSPR
jgi:hypothetical protein